MKVAAILLCTSEQLKTNSHDYLIIDNPEAINKENVSDIVWALAPELLGNHIPRYFFMAEDYIENELIDFQCASVSLLKRPSPAEIDLYNAKYELGHRMYDALSVKKYNLVPIDLNITH